jgi:hypothetical protein
VGASVASPTSANVSWNNPAGTIQAIQIYQSRNGAGYGFKENVPPNRTSAVHTGLDAGAQYCFKVRVQMDGYWSDLSAGGRGVRARAHSSVCRHVRQITILRPTLRKKERKHCLLNDMLGNDRLDVAPRPLRLGNADESRTPDIGVIENVRFFFKLPGRRG